MRILALGDVVGNSGLAHLQRNLWQFRQKEKIDAVVANGENVTEIHGICADDAEALLACGVDVVTLGNHAFGMRDIYPFLENDDRVIRPANYPPQAPGAGYTFLSVCGWRMLCISISGLMGLQHVSGPFDTVDRILQREAGKYDFALMDIHAEATAEKIALGYYFDGRIQIMFGTHTHVTTADERILPKGSGYITDLGMCGPTDGVLGILKEDAIDKMRLPMPVRFHVAAGAPEASGVIYELDTATAKVVGIRRVRF